MIREEAVLTYEALLSENFDEASIVRVVGETRVVVGLVGFFAARAAVTDYILIVTQDGVCAIWINALLGKSGDISLVGIFVLENVVWCFSTTLSVEETVR